MFFNSFQVPDKKQQQKNDAISLGLKKFFLKLKTKTSNKEIWQELQGCTTETQELFLNILLESYPEISQKYDGFFFQNRLTAKINKKKIKELICLVEKNYAWAIKIDFSKPQNQRMKKIMQSHLSYWIKTAPKALKYLWDKNFLLKHCCEFLHRVAFDNSLLFLFQRKIAGKKVKIR